MEGSDQNLNISDAMSRYMLNWSDYAMGSKSALKGLGVTFIVASRELSTATRVRTLLAEYLPKGSVVWGVADSEDYIDGFEGQPQFKSMKTETLLPWVVKVNSKSISHKLYILKYKQRDLIHILKPLGCRNYVFIRGSWKYSFHTSPVFYRLHEMQAKISFVSPFVNDLDAKVFAESTNTVKLTDSNQLQSVKDFMLATTKVSMASYDHSFQVGAILARKSSTESDVYRYIDHAHNQVVPYETYAMHNGFAREDNLAPTNDLNHYDTVHAETMLLINRKVPKNSALFVNVMPCPTCARAIVASGVSEVYYYLDHSNGYALKLFEDSGIKTQRVVI